MIRLRQLKHKKVFIYLFIIIIIIIIITGCWLCIQSYSRSMLISSCGLGCCVSGEVSYTEDGNLIAKTYIGVTNIFC
jgi:hypothetical protein